MALGRGLGELLGEVENAYKNNNKKETIGAGSVVDLDIDKIESNPKQPRKIFDNDKLKELSNSIIQHGLLQPIMVMKKEKEQFILISGERRLRAHKLANIKVIKAIVLDVEEFNLRELALIENIQRDDLNIIEVAYAYAQLINEHNITHDELSKKIFKSRTSITNTLRLLQLSTHTQQLLASNKITAGHGKVMLGLEDEKQKLVSNLIINKKLSVRQTEEFVKNLKNSNNDNTLGKNREKAAYDFSPLTNILEKLKNNQLKVKAEKNYFKIEINSQKDIEKIFNYFRNAL